MALPKNGFELRAIIAFKVAFCAPFGFRFMLVPKVQQWKCILPMETERQSQKFNYFLLPRGGGRANKPSKTTKPKGMMADCQVILVHSLQRSLKTFDLASCIFNKTSGGHVKVSFRIVSFVRRCCCRAI